MKIVKQHLIYLVLANLAFGQTVDDKFKQLDMELPTPNVYRTASGYPGHDYWQNRADYVIDVKLNDAEQKISGEETITYHNNSPDFLNYIWIQLDQNVRAKDSDSYKVSTGSMKNKLSFKSMKPGFILPNEESRELLNEFEGGFNILKVTDKKGNKLPYTINKTMMRIDLPSPIKPRSKYKFSIKWWYNIQDRIFMGGRPGYEYFEEDGNYLYTICQWFPRVAMYNEVYGWQNKQFLGRGEYTLNFGNYEVNFTTPADHVVAATGVLQNSKEILTSEQLKRYNKAKTSKQPIMIITKEEAIENEKSKSNRTKTWKYKAENVRDFAITSSRKFIWDAMGVKFGNRTVMAMSLYPKEAYNLYEKYSTKIVAHTLKIYSKYTFDYPYPVAISVEASNGMEYPMICFNYGRQEKDGTYSERTKYGMMSVIIHEVGHNYFPMIVNSDERQWTWMDEGLNTYLQFLTEQEWDRDYPSRRGPPKNIVNYMKGSKKNMMPIMTNSESIYQFGNNAYGKPATALNILRETIVGRELFDFAFKEYSRTWMFKHPTPADLFRILENATAVDLDWFWRGWFYGTEHVDLSIDKVTWYKIDTKDPEIEFPLKKLKKEEEQTQLWTINNLKDIDITYTEKNPSAFDFYDKFDPYEVTILDRDDFQTYYDSLKLSDLEEKLYKSDLNFYEIQFSNVGGLVMPIILQFTYEDGETEVFKLPAEIWKMNRSTISKVFSTKRQVKEISLDPFLETADVDLNNNYWPPKMVASKFELFKSKRQSRGTKKGENKMQRDKKAKEKEEETAIEIEIEK